MKKINWLELWRDYDEWCNEQYVKKLNEDWQKKLQEMIEEQLE